MRAVLVATLWATSSLAEVGVISTVVEGFDNDISQDRRQQLDADVADTLGVSYVALDLAPGCETNGATAPPSARLPSCIAAATAARPEIDEVAQLTLRHLAPRRSELTLRIFGRDGLPQLQLHAEISEAESISGTRALLRKAFDPARFRGGLDVAGTPTGAELLVDGLGLEAPRAQLRVGRHVLHVIHQDGTVQAVPFEVSFERTTELVVPQKAADGGAPFWVAAGTGIAGILAAGGALVLYLTASDAQRKLDGVAVGDGFLPNQTDPLCVEQIPESRSCPGTNGKRVAWTDGYGPLGEDGRFGEGTRFMMVAVSLAKQPQAESSVWAAAGLGIAGALASVGGAVAFVMLYPSDDVAGAAE